MNSVLLYLRIQEIQENPVTLEHHLLFSPFGIVISKVLMANIIISTPGYESLKIL